MGFAATAGAGYALAPWELPQLFVKRGLVSILEHPSASVDGVGDNGLALNTVLAEASKSARGVFIPKGNYRLNSTIKIPDQGAVLEGEGQDSRLILGSKNSNLIEAISSGRLRLYNLRLSGNGTSSASNNGSALIVRGGDNLELDELWFDGWGNNGIKIDNAGLSRPAMNLDFGSLYFSDMMNNFSPGAENAAIRVEGMVEGLTWRDIQIDAASVNPIANGVSISQLAMAGRGWRKVRAGRLRVSGVARRGLSLSSEFSDDSEQSGDFYLAEGQFEDCGWSGVKTKNIDKVHWRIIRCENCERLGQEIKGNLQGSVFLNGTSDTSGKIISIGGGSDAVRIVGRANGSKAGWGRSNHALVIESRGHVPDGRAKMGGAGLFVGQDVNELHAIVASISDRIGVHIASPTASAGAPTNIRISPTIKQAINSGVIVNAVGKAPNVGIVDIETPDISDCGAFGVVASNVDQLTVSGGLITRSQNDNLRFASANEVSINRGLNATGAQGFGVSFGAGVSNFSIGEGVSLSGNTRGAVSKATLPSRLSTAMKRWL